MPSNLTADDFKAVEDHLKKEYFFVRSQTVWLIVALLAAFGIGTVATAYTAAKSAISSGAAAVATAKIEQSRTTAKGHLESINQTREDAKRDHASIVRIRDDLKKSYSFKIGNALPKDKHFINKPGTSELVDGLMVEIEASGSRPILVSLMPGDVHPAKETGSHIGLDTTNGEVYVSVRVLRNRSHVVGILNFHSKSSVFIPPGALQVLDTPTEGGKHAYTLEVMTVQGTGTFYFDEGVRLAAREL